jgi:hypothetical protein
VSFGTTTPDRDSGGRHQKVLVTDSTSLEKRA